MRIIPPEVLLRFSEGNIHIPRVYYDKSAVVRWLYWGRLKTLLQLAKNFHSRASRVLDFGCGAGIFLPSLAASFDKVIGLDRFTNEAKKVMGHFALKNVELLSTDARKIDLPDESVDCVFAASVLEHFEDAHTPVAEIARILSPGGILVCSTPTENLLYQAARKVFGYVKPADHFQDARSVRKIVEKHFTVEKKMHGPFPLGYELAAYEILVARKK